MPLQFRNIDVTPCDPVREWGFEGMLAALDRGYAEHWVRMAAAVARDPDLEAVFEEAAAAAESAAAVRLTRRLIARAHLSDRDRAGERLRYAARASGLTQGKLAERLGTSRPRVNSYLTGKVTPSMTVLLTADRLAAAERALGNVPELVVR